MLNVKSLNFFKVCIWLIRVEFLITIHHGNQVLSVAEVDNVMRIARQHMDALDVVACDFKLYHLVGAELALLDEAVAGDYDEKLPLGVVPVLAFGDAGAGDVDGDLATV